MCIATSNLVYQGVPQRPRIVKVERIDGDIFITMKIRIAFAYRNKELLTVYRVLDSPLLRVRYTNEKFHRKNGSCTAYYKQQLCEEVILHYLNDHYDMAGFTDFIRYRESYCKRDGKIREIISAVNIVSTEEGYRQFKINQLLR